MKILVESKIKLQGYAIGYEILEGGKVVQKHTYPEPVKNLVVSAGKDEFCGSEAGNALNLSTAWMARGSGSTPAEAGNTQLEAQIGNRTNSILSGDPYTGVKYTAATGLIQARKTYDSEVETSDQNINEIGIFANSTGDPMFARIVLPATVTVLTGQQLRLTYELQITVGPIVSTSSSPSITGWTTAGQSRLEGTLPTTTSFGSGFGPDNVSTNQFIATWDNSGNDPTGSYPYYYVGQSYLNPGIIPDIQNYGYQSGDFEAFDAKTFNTFGDTYTKGTGAAPNNFRVNYPQNGSATGSATYVIEPYVPGTFYRDTVVTLQPNFPDGLDATNIKAIRCRGLTHIFDTPVAKLNTQRLTLTFRVTIA